MLSGLGIPIVLPPKFHRPMWPLPARVTGINFQLFQACIIDSMPDVRECAGIPFSRFGRGDHSKAFVISGEVA